MDPDDHLDLVSERADLLAALVERPMAPRNVVDELGVSRATANRALGDLADADLVERVDEGYVATPGGALALEHYRSVRSTAGGLRSAMPVLDPLAADVDLDVGFVAAAEPREGTDAEPYRPVEWLHETVRDADRYRAVLPTVETPRHVRILYEHVVTDDDPAELVVPESLSASLAGEFPRRLAAMADADGFELRTGDAPPFGLLVTDHGDGRRATVVVYDGGVHGLLQVDEAEAPDAVRWAADRFDRHREAAVPAGEDLRQAADGGVAAAAGGVDDPSLLVALEREGFVRLSPEFFADRPVADPTTAWRAGLDLAEVQVGYAVERTGEVDGDSHSVDETVLDHLRGGRNCAVVGPPGSGKSTVCKQVACEWYRADDPVFYRESGRGRPFESVDALVASARQADGHALVVVEDAVRPEGSAVFEAMAAFGDEVSVLVDAREGEWRDPPAELGADAAAERGSVETVSMPPLLDVDCERLVEHFERTAEVDVDVPLAELRTELAAGHGDVAPHEVFLLLHRLVQYADPLADDETGLGADVRRTYEALEAAGETALDVGTTANLLNAAGIEVTPAALYAVAADDDAVDAALEHLLDEVLFRREDGPAYRTVHEAWSARFLEHLLDADADAAERVGRCLTSLLSLADDPERRRRVAEIAGHDPLGVDVDPGEWADDTVAAVFSVGRRRPGLAPLFGTSEGDHLRLPDACSGETARRRVRWRAEMYRDASAYDRAAAECERLLELASSAGDDADRVRGWAFELRNAVARHRGDRETALEFAEQALDAYRSADDRRGEARALDSLATTEMRQGDLAAATDHGERALETFRTVDDRDGEASVLQVLGVVAAKRGDFETARDRFERGLELARELGDRDAQQKYLHDLGGVEFSVTNLERARNRFRRALELARQLGNPRRETAALATLSSVAESLGDLEAAAEYGEEAMDLAESFGDVPTRTTAVENLASARALLGDHDAAERLEGTAQELAERVDNPAKLATVHAVRGRNALMRADHAAAERHADAAVDLAEDVGLPNALQGGLVVRSRVYRRRGDLDAAERALDRNEETVDPSGDPTAFARHARARSRLARIRGECDDAAGPLREAAEALVGTGARLARASTDLARGELAVDRGDLDGAETHLSDALAAFREMGARWHESRTLLALGRRHRAADSHDEAREHLDAARDLAEDLDDPYHAALATAELGAVAADAGDTAAARETLADAVDRLSSVDARPAALTALDRLVAACDAAGDAGSAREWCDLAVELAAETDLDEKRAAFERRRRELGTADD